MKNKLYVYNIPLGMTSVELLILVTVHGIVRIAEVVRDTDSECFGGYGIVTMAEEADKLSVIKALNGKTIQDRAIIISETKMHLNLL
jgi:hypothetical protein